MFSIIFEPYGRMAKAPSGVTVLQAAEEAGMRIRSECGGNGICGKCRVIIENQLGLEGLREAEANLLTREEILLGYRLACCSRLSRPSGVLTVIIPEESWMDVRKFQETGVEKPVQLEPCIAKYFVSLPRPTINDIRPDLERLLESLRMEYHLEPLDVDYEVLKALSKLLREATWNITAVIWDGSEIISVEVGDSRENVLGLAIDLGTSKIVTQLIDLTTGKIIAVAPVDNPQARHGEDIVARISFAGDKEENLTLLQNLAVSGINETIREVCSKTGHSPNNIYEAIVVGNTAMHHIFLGLRPTDLGLSPFTPTLKRAVRVKSGQLEINMNPMGIVNVLPVIAGFVGADGVADLIASGIYDIGDSSLLIDIGTNTEVFVSSAKEVLCCSCASGPAFEGGHISQGMKAVTGAIEKVRIEERTYCVNFDTIGDAKPMGLCGSGIVDAVAEMLRCRIINHLGRFTHGVDTPRLRKIGNEMEFIIAWKDKSGTRRDISISEKDISEILLAKAAIFAGCSISMKRKKLSQDDLQRVLIAGAFGTNINPESAKTIGLIPDVSSEKVTFIGNSAIVGAKMALISKSVREEAERISERAKYLELTLDPDFTKEFTDALYLPHRDIDRFPSVKRTLNTNSSKES